VTCQGSVKRRDFSTNQCDAAALRAPPIPKISRKQPYGTTRLPANRVPCVLRFIAISSYGTAARGPIGKAFAHQFLEIVARRQRLPARIGLKLVEVVETACDRFAQVSDGLLGPATLGQYLAAGKPSLRRARVVQQGEVESGGNLVRPLQDLAHPRPHLR
jgi:hypothetical protein